MFNILSLFPFLGKGKASDINFLTANDYYDRLKSIALSLFEWEGLPPSCNERFLEMSLYTYGRALFFFDPALGYMNMRCTPSGNLNNYDEPVSYHAYSTIYDNDFLQEDCVLIRNNYLERPTDNSVVLFASRLTEAERTIDVNVKAQKTPVLIRGSEKEILTLKNIYKDYEGNEPVLYWGKSLDLDAIKVFKTDAPFVADKVQLQKERVWNEAMTFFGINNTNTEKRERLITDEVNANNQLISINADVMLLTRQSACEQINKKYGLSVSVKMRSFDEVEKAQETTEETEEKEDNE